MNLCLNLIVLFTFAGCATYTFPEPNPPKKKLNNTLLTGKRATISNHSEVEKELTRSMVPCSEYTFETVSATYITPYSVKLSKKEEGARNLDTQKFIDKSILGEKKELTDNKECFKVSISPYTLESAKFSYWRFKVRDSKGELHEAFPLLKGLDDVPSYTVTQLGTIWSNSNYVCTKKDIKDPEQGFELIPLSQIIAKKCEVSETSLG